MFVRVVDLLSVAQATLVCQMSGFVETLTSSPPLDVWLSRSPVAASGRRAEAVALVLLKVWWVNVEGADLVIGLALNVWDD